MQDFVKQQLAVGDKVVHGVGGRSGGLSGPYFVHSFTPKMVRLSRKFNADGMASVSTIVPSHNLVKVPG